MFGEKKRAKQAALARAELIAHAQAMSSILAGTRKATASCVLKKGERPLFNMNGVNLFEPRKGAGHWTGHSSGMSVPVGGVRLRVGQSRGHYVQGAETPTIIDKGACTITDQRIVFQGALRVQEWQLSKLVGFIHDNAQRSTAIQVSNRQKVSGIAYPNHDPAQVQLSLGVVAAVAAGQETDVLDELHEMIAIDAPPEDEGNVIDADTIGPHELDPQPELSAPAPTPAIAPSAPPAWLTDPSGRHDNRWWDGTRWTEYVADRGEPADNDPI